MPFQPSPNRDDGYDITDYYGVDERLGSLGDFVALVRTAKDRGMRVIVDLVVNHTSDRHPWFRAARSSPSSEFRDYVWADRPPAEPKAEVVFPDAEDRSGRGTRRPASTTCTTLLAPAGPEHRNPEVREEMAKIVGFWLELGVDGFRSTRCPSSSRRAGPRARSTRPPRLPAGPPVVHARRRGDVMMLGEVNLPTRTCSSSSGARRGRGPGLFNFILMQSIYLGMARQDARPIAKALRDTVARPTISSTRTSSATTTS